jgi:hypothetical protein
MTFLADGTKFFDNAFDDVSEDVTFRSNNGTIFTNYNTRMIVTSYKPEEMIGTVTQSDIKGYFLVADFTAGTIPTPKQGDRVIVAGRNYGILDVDASTQKIKGTLLAWICQLQA